jgi:hypothetical protein
LGDETPTADGMSRGQEVVGTFGAQAIGGRELLIESA